MAQVNTCLKRIFTIFNIFFAIVGGVIIGLALLSQVVTNVESNMEGRATGLLLLYIIGAITMIIAILGAYGAHKENKGCMIAFLVCMVIGSLVLLRGGIVLAAGRPKVEPLLEEKFRQMLPLDQAPEDDQEVANLLQKTFHCCGLFSYDDWRDDIPESCLCDEDQSEGQCQTINYKNLMRQGAGPKKVYAQACFPIMMYYLNLMFSILIGITFSLATLALLGMALSSVIIHQMRYPNRATVVLSVPAIFTPGLPKYQELQNSPPKYQEIQNPPPKYQEMNPPLY
ncbi:tetraspanin-8-like [Cheilinus undulatus]|uniref:tetraspanin-8-like n=1 Tax=Cheilinus undulatus TaxID=241271 RepID=UPI001BD3B6CB|nr:tetraspanin-8-like [Cheilinus undulatus]